MTMTIFYDCFAYNLNEYFPNKRQYMYNIDTDNLGLNKYIYNLTRGRCVDKEDAWSERWLSFC